MYQYWAVVRGFVDNGGNKSTRLSKHERVVWGEVNKIAGEEVNKKCGEWEGFGRAPTAWGTKIVTGDPIERAALYWPLGSAHLLSIIPSESMAAFMFLGKFPKGPNFLPFHIQKYKRYLMVGMSWDKWVHASFSSLKTGSRLFCLSKTHRGYKREIYRPVLILTY